MNLIEYRKCIGHVTTGVTVVTCEADDHSHGITVFVHLCFT